MLSEQCSLQSAANLSPENPNLDSITSISQQHRNDIMSNPPNLCTEGTSLEFQLNALNISYN